MWDFDNYSDCKICPISSDVKQFVFRWIGKFFNGKFSHNTIFTASPIKYEQYQVNSSLSDCNFFCFSFSGNSWLKGTGLGLFLMHNFFLYVTNNYLVKLFRSIFDIFKYWMIRAQ